MERVSNKSIEDFPAGTLYFDDLKEIVEIFACACERVEVEAGEFKIKAVAELQDLAEKFHDGRFPDVKITGHDPYITLDLRPYGTRAYISEDTLEQLGVISKVRDLLIRRKKVRPALVFDILVTILFAVGFLLVGEKQISEGVILIALSVVCAAVSIRVRMRTTVIVHTRRSVDRSHFLHRKRDELVLATFSAIVGGVIALVVAKLTK